MIEKMRLKLFLWGFRKLRWIADKVLPYEYVFIDGNKGYIQDHKYIRFFNSMIYDYIDFVYPQDKGGLLYSYKHPIEGDVSVYLRYVYSKE